MAQRPPAAGTGTAGAPPPPLRAPHRAPCGGCTARPPPLPAPLPAPLTSAAPAAPPSPSPGLLLPPPPARGPGSRRRAAARRVFTMLQLRLPPRPPLPPCPPSCLPLLPSFLPPALPGPAAGERSGRPRPLGPATCQDAGESRARALGKTENAALKCLQEFQILVKLSGFSWK